MRPTAFQNPKKPALAKCAAWLALLPLIAGSTSSFAADNYFIDTSHSEIRFAWSHGGVSIQTGEFTNFDGEAVFDEDDLSKSSVSVTIKAESAVTGIRELDGNLNSAYYFSAKEHPEITFVSTGVRPVASKRALITGDLTMRGITRPVTLHAELRHHGEHPVGVMVPFNRGEWMGIVATTSLLRSEFGMDALLPVVSDQITISITAELKKRKKK